MASGYFASLVTRPTIIDSPGEYVTRGGELVTITASSGRHDFGCRGTYPNGVQEGWHKSGFIYSCKQTQNDIVGKAP